MIVGLERNTSRPSQNSASVIWPPMTRSLCRVARSELLIRTLLRSLKSLAWSITGVVARFSLVTDAARERGRGRRGCWERGTRPRTRGVGALKFDVLCVGVVLVKGVIGTGGDPRDPASAAVLLTETIPVNSFLNFSLSLRALGETNVKLWPFSSVNNATLSLTWGAPSLLQNNATKKRREGKKHVSSQSKKQTNKQCHFVRLTRQLSPRDVYRWWCTIFLGPLEMGIGEFKQAW